jgi:hypothetical protein
MMETVGGGAGWLDVDRDGYWDLYLCQGGDPKGLAAQLPSDELLLLRNGKFRPATVQARCLETGYGQGVAVGDFDDDGFDDVYVSNYGPNVLWRNLGDGMFEDVTMVAGVGDHRWSTSTAWGDLDGDGDLDLYVCNYAEYDALDPRICTDRTGRRRTCDPLEVESQPDRCYENLGDGTFRDVTTAWGFNGTNDRSLGVVILDLTEDRRPDVFVANDVTANFLYVQSADGRFEERGVLAGIAMNTLGNFQASMGVALGDYDADGLADLYLTHFTDDSNTLYRNLGGGGFEDITRFVGLHQPTLPYLGFGTVFQDFNADGRMDVIVANGHIDDRRQEGGLWKMPAQLFTFMGDEFAELTGQLGGYFAREVIGRGVAQADYDADGDMDLVMVHQDEPTALLRNDSDRGRWLHVSFIGRSSNRRGIGARVTAECGDTVRTGWLAGGTSYCSSQEPSVYLGLGNVGGPCRVTIDWPSGITQTIENVELDQRLTVTEPNASAM